MNSYCQIQVAGSTSGDSSNQVLDSLPRRENRRSSRSQGNTNLKEKLKRRVGVRKVQGKNRRPEVTQIYKHALILNGNGI